MVGGVISWGLYSSFLKKKKLNLPLLTLVHILCTFGLIFIFPQFLYELSQGQVIKFDINLGYILVFLALFPSIGSYYFWAGSVSIIGANRAGIFLSLIPLFSTIMAIIFFNEKFYFFHLIGAILIILGLFLSNKENNNA
jgi:drug/metabolite transporter (DMT)-like permease